MRIYSTTIEVISYYTSSFAGHLAFCNSVIFLTIECERLCTNRFLQLFFCIMPCRPVERKRLSLCKACSCTFTFSLCSGFRRELTYTRSTLAVVVLKLQSRRKAYRTQDGVIVVTTQQLLFILRTIGPQQNTERNTDEIPGQHILLFYLKVYYHLIFYFKTHILLNINVALVSHVFPFDTLTNPLPYIFSIGLLRVQY